MPNTVDSRGPSGEKAGPCVGGGREAVQVRGLRGQPQLEALPAGSWPPAAQKEPSAPLDGAWVAAP